jgi:Uma2 family endonuclease
VSTQPKTFLTPEQYLEIERAAEFKSEYVDGEMFAMSGAREGHVRIVTNLVIALGQRLLPRGCGVFSNDLRVRVNRGRLYTYPDLVVVCDQPSFLDDTRDTLLNPSLIVEVLSPSTEAYDRGKKFDHYQRLKSLQAYLLVASDRAHADLFIRQPDDRWVLSPSDGPEAFVEIASLDCRIALAEIYQQVEFR